jgi:hypothetical protein
MPGRLLLLCTAVAADDCAVSAQVLKCSASAELRCKHPRVAAAVGAADAAAVTATAKAA